MTSSNNWLQSTNACRLNSGSTTVSTFPLGDPCWPADQTGLMHGAILVERLRTFGGTLCDLTYNKMRLASGARHLGWNSEQVVDAFEKLVQSVVKENRLDDYEILSRQARKPILASAITDIRNSLSLEIGSPTPIKSIFDVGVVVLFLLGSNDSWDAIAHLSEIPYSKLNNWYANGISLRSIPNSFQSLDQLPTDIKHRSRLAYWLADRQASSQQIGSLALLTTSQGHVADTSIANLIARRKDGIWVTPQHDCCHTGVTIRRTEALLQEQGIPLQKARFTVKELLDFDEAFLIGSTGLAIPIHEIDGIVPSESAWQVKHDRSSHPSHFERDDSEEGWKFVNRLWSKFTGMDVVAQARLITELG